MALLDSIKAKMKVPQAVADSSMAKLSQTLRLPKDWLLAPPPTEGPAC